jgi:hypothetical protein
VIPVTFSARSALLTPNCKDRNSLRPAADDRDRGKPRGSSTPTPPEMPVRIRRFDGLSYRLKINLAVPSESKEAWDSAIWSPGEPTSRHGPDLRHTVPVELASDNEVHLQAVEHARLKSG